MIKQTLNKILVLLDGSKNSLRGLDMAIDLARSCHATITGLHAISSYIVSFPPIVSVSIVTPIQKVLKEEALKFMEQAKIRCTKNGIIFFSKIIPGPEGPKIVSYINKNDFDLVVVGTRGRGAVREVFLGSVSNYVLHRCITPLLVVK